MCHQTHDLTFACCHAVGSNCSRSDPDAGRELIASSVSVRCQIDPEQVSISEHVLCRGAWGVVSKGKLTRATSTEVVAIKMLPEITSENERAALEREL